jgi:hypothetical protein
MLDAMRGELHVIRCAVGGDAVPVLRGTLELKSRDELSAVMQGDDPHLIGIGPDCARRLEPHARGAATVIGAILAGGPADLDTWEPRYGRMAEAEVRLARTNHGVTA